MAHGAWLAWRGAGTPASGNVYWVLFTALEPAQGALGVLAVALVLGRPAGRAWQPASVWPRVMGALLAPNAVFWVALAVGTLCVTAVGSVLVFQRFPLSLDEYMAEFQARIFAAGQVKASVPSEWQPLEAALTPVFVVLDAQRHTWVGPYLPGYALLRTPLEALGAGWLLNAVLAALTVLVLGACLQRVLPGQAHALGPAALMLVTSNQFLVTSMTSYAAPAHLLANVTWLWLFASNTLRRHCAAALVGVLAISLHQPHVHPLFAFPFLLRLVFQRRWGLAALYLAVYASALGGAAAWWTATKPSLGGEVPSLFAWPSWKRWEEILMSAELMATWLPLPLLAGLMVGAARYRQLPPLARDALWSVVLTFGFHMLHTTNQGHGWGYRYVYAVLGCMVVVMASALVTPALDHARAAEEAGVSASGLLGFAAFSLLVQGPLRAVQVRDFVTPFASASAAIQQAPADLVLLDLGSAWYLVDLVRNDPLFIRPPKVVMLQYLDAEGAALVKSGRYSVRMPREEELAAHGLFVRGPKVQGGATPSPTPGVSP